MRDTWLETLRWYVSARGRLGLSAFNWILFFVFVPSLVLQFYAVYHFMQSAGDMVGSLGRSGDLNSMVGALNQMLSPQQEDLTFLQAVWQKVVLPMLPYITYAFMIPAVVMRLRDINWDPRWATVIAFGAGLGMAKHVLGMDIPLVLRGIFFCVELWLMTMLAFKKSAPVKERTMDEKF